MVAYIRILSVRLASTSSRLALLVLIVLVCLSCSTPQKLAPAWMCVILALSSPPDAEVEALCVLIGNLKIVYYIALQASVTTFIILCILLMRK